MQGAAALSSNSASWLRRPSSRHAAVSPVTAEGSHLSSSSSSSVSSASITSTAATQKRAAVSKDSCRSRNAGSKASAAAYVGQVQRFSTAVQAIPAAWLPQQHPAVITALKQDLGAAACGQQQQQQCSKQETLSIPLADNSSNSGSVATKGKQKQPLQLLAPLFPGTAPTLEFSAVDRQGFDWLTEQPLGADSSSLWQLADEQTVPGQQQQQQHDGRVLQLQTVKAYVKYYKVANNAVKQVSHACTPGNTWGWCPDALGVVVVEV